MTAGSGTHSPAAGAVFLLPFQRDALQGPEPGRVQNLSPHISTECLALANPFFLAVERAKCTLATALGTTGDLPMRHSRLSSTFLIAAAFATAGALAPVP